MTERFVPFAAKVPAGNTAEPFRVKVLVNANDGAVPFQPLGAIPGAVPVQIPHGGHPGQPQVSLVRDGERITSIRVQCGCGEVIELQCLY